MASLVAILTFGCRKGFCEMRHSAELSVVGRPVTGAALRLTASAPSPPRTASVNIDCSICELIGKHEKGGDVVGRRASRRDTVQESDHHDLTRQTDRRESRLSREFTIWHERRTGTFLFSLAVCSSPLQFGPQSSCCGLEGGSHDPIAIAFHKNFEESEAQGSGRH